MNEKYREVATKSGQSIGILLTYILAAMAWAIVLTGSWIISTGIVTMFVRTARALGWL